MGKLKKVLLSLDNSWSKLEAIQDLNVGSFIRILNYILKKDIYLKLTFTKIINRADKNWARFLKIYLKNQSHQKVLLPLKENYF